MQTVTATSIHPQPPWFAAALADAPERSWVEVEGALIEMLAWGPRGAPGLLLFHGFRAHADWWSHIAPFFARTHRVVALSWSGMGRSGWREAYDLDLYAREAMAAARAAGAFEGSSRPSIAAHSLGGFMAAILAAGDHGADFDQAIIIDSTIGPREPVPPAATAGRLFGSLEEVVARFRFTPRQDALPYVAEWIACNSVAHRQLDDGREGWLWRFDPMLVSALSRFSPWSRLPDARCRLSFVRGALSQLITEKFEAIQREKAPPGTRFVTIPDAGHHILADQPLALVATLRALLA